MALHKASSFKTGDVAPPAASADSVATVRIELWDLPLRVFHWSLLAAVAAAIVTGEIGGAWIEWHAKAGITIVGLLAFRVVWGLIGPTPARFIAFAPTPGKLLAYVQGRWRGVGHNPLGALSVFALLGLLAFQAGSGLLSNDDISFAGPLAFLIGDEASHAITNWHHQSATVLFVLLGLHVAAILFYTHVKKDKLVRPMVTGWKDVPADLPKPQRARRISLAMAIAVGVGAAYGASGAWVAKDPAPVPPSSTPADKASTDKAPAW